ncbi:MAG: hypothetical protein LBR47_07130 [Spirochaetaceae bacterium]|jgi:hypothetical protein|nr:hypothetical protein [Spirochaetaceae bacterium]
MTYYELHVQVSYGDVKKGTVKLFKHEGTEMPEDRNVMDYGGCDYNHFHQTYEDAVSEYRREESAWVEQSRYSGKVYMDFNDYVCGTHQSVYN